jgi:hypothetical protein
MIGLELSPTQHISTALSGKRLAVPLAAMFGTLITAVSFYPGYLDGDSTWQYRQVLSGVFNDKDPVIMAWAWSYLHRVIPGSGGLFLVTTACFWTGLAMIVRSFTRSTLSFLFVVFFIGFFVPNFAMLSQIQKDVGMVVTLLLGYGALLVADRKGSFTVLCVALLSLWYALAVRHNSVLAAAPFVVWSGYLLARDHLPVGVRKNLTTGLRKSGVGVLVLLAMMATSSLANIALLGDTPPRYKIWLYETLFAYDLAGVAVRSGRNYLPRGHFYPARPLELADLERLYHPHTVLFLYWGGPQERFGASPKERRLPMIADARLLAHLRNAWITAIVREPRAYLAHRSELFLAHLGVLEDTPYRKVQFVVWVNSNGKRVLFYPYRGPMVFDLPHNQWLTATIAKLVPTALFRPWPYLALSVVCLFFAWRWRFHVGHVALLGASSFLYTLPYAVIGVSSEFRYLWWSVVVSLLQLLIVANGVQQRSRAGLPQAARG